MATSKIDLYVSETITSLAELLGKAQSQGVARLDAQLLLLHALGRPAADRAWLIAHDGDAAHEAVLDSFEALARRRVAGEPLAYLVGRQAFFGLDFEVDTRVLIPRPDTETLVVWALERAVAAAGANPGATLRILDLGTGSGAIALAVAHELGRQNLRTQIVAVDASAGALAVARSNHARLRIGPAVGVKFIESDWFAKVSGTFDVIMSNPPYIASGDAHLAALAHEPLTALTAGFDGLGDLRRIIDGAPRHLAHNGWLMLEHGHDQATAVQRLLAERGFMQIESRPDLAGIMRCTAGRAPD
jgi:release factor glutamine methyltransferase